MGQYRLTKIESNSSLDFLLVSKFCIFVYKPPYFPTPMRQCSLSVSYAMPINKSYGQSFANVEIFLKNIFFSHGQLYMVVTNRNGLKILVCGDDERLRKKKVSFKEVFQNL
ncbi:hypothetical protein ACS0TY_017312 [Phlomoides rotata]